ncbi:MAG: hypothetical protein ACLSH7_06860 [Veillonella parvula]
MKKIALTSLAVMAVVGVFAIQPVDAKKVEQDPVMTPIDMPMNDEIQYRLMVFLNQQIKKHDVCLIL